MGQAFSDYIMSWIEPLIMYMLEKIMQQITAKIKPGDSRHWDTYEYEGVHMWPDVLPGTLDDLKTFDVRPDDVFIVTYPKAGTTWTQEITSCILYDGNMAKINSRHTMLRVPFLEMTIGGSVHPDLPRTHKMVRWMRSPRFIKSHLPGELLPPQIWQKRVKIVCVLRNPKDVATSYFHHCQMMSPTMTLDWDEYFHRFHTGTLGFGKWWEHYLYFWERRDEDHILLLRFEDIKKDLRGTVLRISKFLGKSLSDDVIDDITDHCTFANMKKNPMTNPDTLLHQILGKQEGRTFMRKGVVGNWKAHLSESQAQAIDDLCRDKLASHGLFFN